MAEVIDGGIAASGLVAHTLISRFVDHLPYYRQQSINARSGVHTPRSTLASISGQAGAALELLLAADSIGRCNGLAEHLGLLGPRLPQTFGPPEGRSKSRHAGIEQLIVRAWV